MEQFVRLTGRRMWTCGLLASSLIWGAGTALGLRIVPDGQHATEPSQPQVVRARRDHSSAPVEASRQYMGILGRNLAVYLWLLCGLASGGLTTLGVLFFNGVLLGHTTAAALGMGMPPGRLAWLLLPHGIPEIGTFLVGGAIGLQGTTLLARWIAGISNRGPLGRLWLPAAVGCPILAGAAAIEVRLTVPLANWASQP